MRHKLRNLNRPSMKKAAIICIVIICLVGVVVNRMNSRNNDHGGHGNNGLPQVETMVLQRADMKRHIDLSGQVVAEANIVLAPKYAGRVTDVKVNLGDQVNEGDILLVQDTGDLDISILQNEAAAHGAVEDAITEGAAYDASFQKTKASYEIAKDHYERQQYLLSIGAISQDTLDAARDEFVIAEGAYEALANQYAGAGTPASVLSKQYAAEKSRYATDALRKQREDMILRAPRSGVIGYRNVEVGSYLSAGTKVLTLVDNSHVFVDCALSENDAPMLSIGMPVDVTIDAMGQTFGGKLVFISPAMDDSAKTYTARISLDISKSTIRAGLFAHGTIDIIQRRDTLFVPKTAVIAKNGKTSVWVMLEDGTVEERAVTIGLLNNEDEEILTGLQAGDKVILTNQDRLQAGIKVEIKE